MTVILYHLVTLAEAFKIYILGPLGTAVGRRPWLLPLQYAREQMGIRTNGFFDRKLLANFSRTNGHSNKWGFCREIAKLSRKWEDFEKKLVKQQGFRDQNVCFSGNGDRKKL